MNLSMPRLSWTKSIEVLLCVAALGVLVENIVLLRQNRGLQESLAPQIAGGTQLQMLSGLTLDGRIVPVGLSPAGSKLLVFTFSPGCPACQANQPNWMSLASRLGQNGGVRVLWVSRDPIEITKECCLKRGIPLSDILADHPIELICNVGWLGFPTHCWWTLVAWWRKCGPDVRPFNRTRREAGRGSNSAANISSPSARAVI